MLENKDIIRKSLLEKRRQLSASERQQAALTLQANLLKFLADKEFQSLGGYSPIRGEIDILPSLEALRQQGKTIALPRLPAVPGALPFHEFFPNELEKGRFDIPQPPASARQVVPDILLIPLVAFDKQGYRLGYGGGYYDRTLAALDPRPLAIGCAYAFQQVETLPAEPHDQQLDIVITG